MSDIAVTYGLMFMVVFYYIFTRDMLEKPKSSMDTIIFKALRVKDIIVFFHLIGIFLFNGFMWFLVGISAGTTYEDIITTFASIITWLAVALFIGYTSVYVIYRVYEEFKVYMKPPYNRGGKKNV